MSSRIAGVGILVLFTYAVVLWLTVQDNRSVRQHWWQWAASAGRHTLKILGGAIVFFVSTTTIWVAVMLITGEFQW